MARKPEMIAEMLGDFNPWAKKRASARLEPLLSGMDYDRVEKIHCSKELREVLSNMLFLPKRLDIKAFIESYKTKEMIFILKNMGRGSTFKRFRQLEDIVKSLREFGMEHLNRLIKLDRVSINSFICTYEYNNSSKSKILEVLSKV